MRFTLAFFAFALTTLCLRAQEVEKFKEIGLNAGPLVHQFLNFSETPVEFSPYILTYEQRCGKIGFRVGAGLNAINSFQAPDFDNNLPEVADNAMTAALRAGVVMYSDLSARWGLSYGLDAMYVGNTKSTETTTFDFFGTEVVNTVSDRTREGGLSPFLFIRFRFGPRFSMATEVLGRATYLLNVQSEESTQFPEFNTRNESTGTRFNISAPTALFFTFRF